MYSRIDKSYKAHYARQIQLTPLLIASLSLLLVVLYIVPMMTMPDYGLS